MLSDVVEEGGEDRQKGDGGVVDVLGHTLDLLADTHKQSHAGTRTQTQGHANTSTHTNRGAHTLTYKHTHRTIGLHSRTHT